MEKKPGKYEMWKCKRCGADLGVHPRGIELKCRVCGKIYTPGFNDRPLTQEQIDQLQAMKEAAKKRAKQKYRVMRER